VGQIGRAITEVVVAQQLWAGVDAGKSDHHCVVIDTDGQRLRSQRVANDETVLDEFIEEVTTLADGGAVTWAMSFGGHTASWIMTSDRGWLPALDATEAGTLLRRHASQPTALLLARAEGGRAATGESLGPAASSEATRYWDQPAVRSS
jgi:Transposase